MYHEGSRRLQDRFDTRRLADRIDERFFAAGLDDDDRRFIERCDMVFIATADAEAAPTAPTRAASPGSSACSTSARSRCQLRRQRHVPLHGEPAREPARRPAVHQLRGARRLRLNGVARSSRTIRCWPTTPRRIRRPGARRAGVPELPALHPPLPARGALSLRPEGRLQDARAGLEARDWSRTPCPSRSGPRSRPRGRRARLDPQGERRLERELGGRE